MEMECYDFDFLWLKLLTNDSNHGYLAPRRTATFHASMNFCGSTSTRNTLLKRVKGGRRLLGCFVASQAVMPGSSMQFNLDVSLVYDPNWHCVLF